MISRPSTRSRSASAVSPAVLPEADTTTSGVLVAESIAAKATSWVLVGANKSPDLSARAGASERADAAAEISERMVTQEV